MKTRSFPFTVGILGGMGPLATVLFQKYLIEETPAKKDQDHLRVVTMSDPSVPDRTTALTDPQRAHQLVRQLRVSASALERMGAHIIAMPCHTAHAWHADIQRELSVPLLHMVDLTAEMLASRTPQAVIGLLATEGTYTQNLFERSTAGRRLQWVTPNEKERAIMMDAIYRMKAEGPFSDPCSLYEVATSLMQQGATTILLGCTELSLLAESFQKHVEGIIVDPLRLLARECVSRAEAKNVHPLITPALYTDFSRSGT